MDILRNVIVSGYVTVLPNQQFFVSTLWFHYWQNAFSGRIWPTGHSLETLH